MTAPPRPLRIGTRGSALALRQTALVRDLLVAAHPELAAPGAIEIVPIRTTGDREQHRRLAEIGGKGLFAREIEDALLAGRIDLAVHSLKDLETWLPQGLTIGCVPPREDPRDVLLSRDGASLSALPRGATVGTASLRRQAQLLARRPDLKVLPLRGNVDTRLAKLARGEIDAVVLAQAGLARLGRTGLAGEILSPEIMLPAVGQGAIAVECRTDADRVQALLRPLDDPASAACTAAERAMLAALDGSCRTPIAGLATIADDRLRLDGLVAKPDGSAEIRGSRAGPAAAAVALGRDLGEELRRRAGPGFALDA